MITSENTDLDANETESWDDLRGVLEKDGLSEEAIEKATATATGNVEPPEMETPLDGPVKLPGGFRRFTGADSVEEVHEAWVRELTGEDEERIAKARLKGNNAAVIEEILAGGVERLGEEAPRPGELLDLLAGDREFLLLQISIATFGDGLEYEQVTCPQCAQAFGVALSKADDIPSKSLHAIEESYFDVTLRNGDVAHVRLPNGRDQRAAFDSERTPAETNSVFLSRVIETVTKKDGTEVVVSDEPGFVKRLGSMDRQKILTEVSERNPGPRYNEVKFNHDPGCGAEITFSVGLMELFRGL